MYEYHRPTTLSEAWRLFEATPGARFIAGGTDMMVHRKRADALTVPALISLRNIAELGGIEVGDTIRIGAAATIAQVGRHPDIAELLPALASATNALGTPQIRNVATIGGNLGNASPCADTAPPLLCYEASVTIAGPGGKREVALCDCFRGPGVTVLATGELITAINIPRPAPTTRAVYMSKGRVATDLTLASVAVLVCGDSKQCDKVRVAAGAVAPIPLRLREVEAHLTGAALTDPEVIARARALASAEVAPIDDIRATADYRRHMVGVFVERALAEVV
jgi:carbon-monoxide dehydrogenase medium subunit